MLRSCWVCYQIPKVFVFWHVLLWPWSWSHSGVSSTLVKWIGAMRSRVSIIETMLDIGIRLIGLGGSHHMAGIKVMLEVGPIEIDGSYSNLTRAQEIPTRFLVILSVLGCRRIATISRLTTTPVQLGFRRDATAVASGLEEGDDMSSITCHLVTTTAYYFVLFGWTLGKSRLVGLPVMAPARAKVLDSLFSFSFLYIHTQFQTRLRLTN